MPRTEALPGVSRRQAHRGARQLGAPLGLGWPLASPVKKSAYTTTRCVQNGNEVAQNNTLVKGTAGLGSFLLNSALSSGSAGKAGLQCADLGRPPLAGGPWAVGPGHPVPESLTADAAELDKGHPGFLGYLCSAYGVLAVGLHAEGTGRGTRARLHRHHHRPGIWSCRGVICCNDLKMCISE